MVPDTWKNYIMKRKKSTRCLVSVRLNCKPRDDVSWNKRSTVTTLVS